MFALRVVRDKRLHLAHEVGLLLLIFTLAGPDNLQEKIGRVLSLRFVSVLETEECIRIYGQAPAPVIRPIEKHGPALLPGNQFQWRTTRREL